MHISRELKNAVLMWLGIVLCLFISYKLNRLGDKYDDYYPPRVEYGDVIGIDLGRDFSRVGYMRGYSFEPISDEQGRTAIPNYVAFPKLGNNVGPPIVGFEAREQALSNPQNTFYDFRRLLGRNSSDPDVKRAIKELPYKILGIQDRFDQPMIRVGVKNDYTAYKTEEYTAMIMEKLKGMAETHLNTTIENAIITVPYEFDEQQKNATIEAARLAKLNVLDLMDEPNAIAMAYRLGSTYCDGEGKVVDCRYIIYEHDGRAAHMTLFSAGNPGYGVLGTITEDPENDSTNSFWALLLNQLPGKKAEPPTAESQSKRTLELVDRLLVVSNRTKENIDSFIIITNDPEHGSNIQNTLEAYFPGKKAIKPYNDCPPEQAIVYGASMLAFQLTPEDACAGLPMDATSLSFGIETKNGSFHRILHRWTVTPTRKATAVSMNSRNQSNFSLPIYEGEHELAARNHHLGDILIDFANFSDETRESWRVEQDVNGTIEFNLHFEVDAVEFLRVYVEKGEDYVKGFSGHVMGQQWNWREVEDIARGGMDAKEEELRILAKGGIIGVGEIEVKKRGK
ncbi:hypothetical protein ACEPPN_000705 [Leptodophora sp. 'Broadleaf-Isolate-01']